MAATFVATALPGEEALAPVSEFIAADGDPVRTHTPVSLLHVWGLSESSPSDRVEVLVREAPVWISGAASEGGAAAVAPRSPGHLFALSDLEIESTARPTGQDLWIGAVVRRFIELLDLPLGWDGHGGRPPGLAYVSKAVAFLAKVMGPATAPPSIVPTSDGGLQLEWHRSGLDVEILFSPEEEPTLYVHDRATGAEDEVDPTDGFGVFNLGMRLAR